MKQMEDEIQQAPNYSKYCLAVLPVNPGEPVTCDKSQIKSPVTMLIGMSNFDTLSQQDLEKNFLSLLNGPMWMFYKTLFDVNVSPSNLKINNMRSIFVNGFPLQNETFRFQNATHLKSEQTDILKTYLKSTKEAFDAQNTEDFGFNATFLTFNLLFDQILRMLYRDFALVFVSIFLVFSWFCLHLRSGFLATVGMTIIFLSFPFTAFVVSGLFRVMYFGYL
jgi:hypothetical protein